MKSTIARTDTHRQAELVMPGLRMALNTLIPAGSALQIQGYISIGCR
jgi:hypothetical protein